MKNNSSRIVYSTTPSEKVIELFLRWYNRKYTYNYTQVGINSAWIDFSNECERENLSPLLIAKTLITNIE